MLLDECGLWKHLNERPPASTVLLPRHFNEGISLAVKYSPVLAALDPAREDVEQARDNRAMHKGVQVEWLETVVIVGLALKGLVTI